MKVAFVGAGAMGEAMVSGILASKLTTPNAITVSDVSEARRQSLRQAYGVSAVADNAQAAKGSDVVVLAIKPQNLKTVLAGLNGVLDPGQVVLSIVAGARVKDISAGLSHQAVVRAMPNMPAQVSRAATVWTATGETTEGQRSLVQGILKAIGSEYYVPDEKYVDMATAVSGSGPAYIFLVIEALTDAAVHIGMPRDLAERLVLDTVAGSAHAVQATGKHPAQLKNMVTSPGGTTAEALLELEQGGLRALFARAVISAYQKTVQLG
ncbi:MAG: pyrroline-5-carboxylate reductase [Chloroflexi bacterium]|nr:pyrroline-5-carboxylate reductase [Chloroflexota bacterium]